MDLTVLSDFLPPAKRWRLSDLGSPGQTTVIPLAWSHDAHRRGLEMGAATGTPPSVLFDRIAVSNDTLELHRARLRGETYPLRPLTVKRRGASDPVVDLFPGSGACLDGPPPYRGGARDVIEETVETPTLRLRQWKFTVKVAASNGAEELSTTLAFVNGLGLRRYQGQRRGVFFVFERHVAVDGVWVMPEQQLTLMLSQDGPLVAGHFERENDANTHGEVLGYFDGEVLHLDWETLDLKGDRLALGTAEFTLSDDAQALRGRFVWMGIDTEWDLRRPPKPVPPAPYVSPYELLMRSWSNPRRWRAPPPTDHWFRKKYVEWDARMWDRHRRFLAQISGDPLPPLKEGEAPPRTNVPPFKVWW